MLYFISRPIVTYVEPFLTQALIKRGGSGLERLADNFIIDLSAEDDRLLHLLLVVALSTLSLNVLLDAVDGRLVGDQALLNLVETVVNLVLKDHVTAGIMLHGVISRLLGDAGAVSGHLLLDQPQALLLCFVGGLELTDAGELVGHFVFHAVDVLRVDFHLLVHAALQVSDFLEITTASFDFDLKRGSSALSLVQLTLLEVEIFAHLLNLVNTRESLLAIQILRHMLKEGNNRLLRVGHLSLQRLLLLLVLLSEFVDLLLLGVENLELFLAAHTTCAAFSAWLVAELVFDLFDVARVVVDHLT